MQTKLETKASSYLCDFEDIKNEKILIGFSGGADSTALLVFMANFVSNRENIVAVHINHMIRGIEADNDEEHSRKVCENLGVRFISKKIDIPKISGGSSIEEVARNERYKAFSEIAKIENIKYIALAHNAKDNAETIIMNLVRGCGIDGICGIPYTRVFENSLIIRPLIECNREEIIEYCILNKVDFVIDSTNIDTHYKRNFVRHEILPKLEELNINLYTTLSNFSKNMKNEKEFIESSAKEVFDNLQNKKIVDKKFFNNLNQTIKAHLICLIYENMTSKMDLENIHISNIIDLAKKDEGNLKISLPNEVLCSISGNKISFNYEKDLKSFVFEEKILKNGLNIITNNNIIYLSSKTDDENISKLKNEYNKYFVKGFKLLDNSILKSSMPSSTSSYVAGNITRKIKKLKTSLSYNERLIRPEISLDGYGTIWYPGFDMCDDFKSQNPNIYIHYFEKD